jgi:hypothetical protein
MGNDGWITLRDKETGRFLGRFNPQTGMLIIPHRGHENSYDLRNVVPIFEEKEPVQNA